MVDSNLTQPISQSYFNTGAIGMNALRGNRSYGSFLSPKEKAKVKIIKEFGDGDLICEIRPE